MSDIINHNRPNNILDKVFKERKKLGIILFSLIACCILIIDIVFFTLSIPRPYMGLELIIDDQEWTVRNVDPNGTAFQSGIKIGDIPITINGQPAQIFLGKYIDAGAVYGPLIQQITITDSSNNLKSANLENSSQSIRSIIELIMWIVTCFIFWIIGFFVFYKRPNLYAAKLLCLCGLFFGLTLSANMAAERAIPTAIQFAICSLVISPFLLLHFFLVLPEERAQIVNSSLTYLIYIPAVITLILFPIVGFANGQSMLWFRSFRLIEFIIVLLAVAGVAIYNYVRATSQRTRQQMKIMLGSSVTALIPFLILSFIFPAIWKQTSVPYGFHVLFLSFIPLGMGYAVVTQRLLDIDLIIRRGVIYGIITVITAIILAAGIFPAVAFQRSIGVPEEIIITIALSIVATVLFGPLKKSTEFWVDRLFYKDRYDYRKIIRSLSDSLNTLNDFNDISRLIVSVTASTLNLNGACLFTKSQSGTPELRAVHGIFEDGNTQQRLLTLIYKHNRIIEFPNSASTLYPEIEYLIPLIAGEKEIGFLCISAKATRQHFSHDDIYLLQGVASVAASALRNAMLVRDVSLRNTFVSIVSHELRTPLTAIVGFADLLFHRNPPEDTRKLWAQNIYIQADKLSTLVEELLNVTRIQSGKTRLNIRAEKLSFVLEEQLDMTRYHTNKHELVINMEPDLPDVLIDRDKFGHVILNILNNAVKYSPNGGQIKVSASYEKQRNRVVVAISDEGIGIGPADKESLFTTFHRIQRPETASIGGSGLGLYIAKEWTEAMGGAIWLESELNKGSTFFVGVPVQKTVTLVTAQKEGGKNG
jgi:signal transduction histidine kinase